MQRVLNMNESEAYVYWCDLMGLDPDDPDVRAEWERDPDA